MIKTKQDFDYIKIKLASPERIREWGQRLLPNGQIIGEITKPKLLIIERLNLKWMGCFVNEFLVQLKIGNVIVENINVSDIKV